MPSMINFCKFMTVDSLATTVCSGLRDTLRLTNDDTEVLIDDESLDL